MLMMIKRVAAIFWWLRCADLMRSILRHFLSQPWQLHYKLVTISTFSAGRMREVRLGGDKQIAWSDTAHQCGVETKAQQRLTSQLQLTTATCKRGSHPPHWVHREVLAETINLWHGSKTCHSGCLNQKCLIPFQMWTRCLQASGMSVFQETNKVVAFLEGQLESTHLGASSEVVFRP